jgi:hypothetical protein
VGGLHSTKPHNGGSGRGIEAGLVLNDYTVDRETNVKAFLPKNGYSQIKAWCLLFVFIRQGLGGGGFHAGFNSRALVKETRNPKSNLQRRGPPSHDLPLRASSAFTLSLILPNTISQLLVTRRHSPAEMETYLSTLHPVCRLDLLVTFQNRTTKDHRT